MHCNRFGNYFWVPSVLSVCFSAVTNSVVFCYPNLNFFPFPLLIEMGSIQLFHLLQTGLVQNRILPQNLLRDSLPTPDY